MDQTELTQPEQPGGRARTLYRIATRAAAVGLLIYALLFDPTNVMHNGRSFFFYVFRLLFFDHDVPVVPFLANQYSLLAAALWFLSSRSLKQSRQILSVFWPPANPRGSDLRRAASVGSAATLWPLLAALVVIIQEGFPTREAWFFTSVVLAGMLVAYVAGWLAMTAFARAERILSE